MVAGDVGFEVLGVVDFALELGPVLRSRSVLDDTGTGTAFFEGFGPSASNAEKTDMTRASQGSWDAVDRDGLPPRFFFAAFSN